jgi:hypothetical protein
LESGGHRNFEDPAIIGRVFFVFGEVAKGNEIKQKTDRF